MRSSYIAAGVVVMALSLWMASGLLRSDNKTQETRSASDNQTAPMKVEVQIIKLSSKSREIVLQGQLEPKRRLMIRAETSGKVESLAVNKGQRIKTGAAIVNLNINNRASELAEAEAQLKSAASQQRAEESLRQGGLQSQVQLEQSQAQLESARAVLSRIQLDIANTNIIAPFDGIINSLPIEVGELMERGDVIAELVDDSSFRVTAQAAQQSVAELAVNQPVTVRLITGQTLEGKLTFISSVANRDTRSFAVEAEVENSDSAVAAGISASLVIPVEQIEAAFISPSALSLGDDGELGVKVVDTDNQVAFLPIELVSTAIDGAWVTGIPDNSHVITLGQGFVNAGEVIDPQIQN